MAKAWHRAKTGANGECVIRSFADGDTVNIAVRCTCELQWHTVILRIAGIESWELDSVDKVFALNARDELNRLFKWKRGELFCKIVNCDRYGRAIGDVKINGRMLSQIIVENGFGYIVNQTKIRKNHEHHHTGINGISNYNLRVIDSSGS